VPECHTKSLLVWVLFSSFLQQTMRNFGVKENEYSKWVTAVWGLWRVVSECADNKFGMARIEPIATERSYLLSFWRSSVGKRQAPVWETAVFWYRARRSAVCYHLRWKKFSPLLKRADAERGFLSATLTLCHPRGPWLLGGAFEDAW